MDLRSFGPSAAQIARAKELAVQGLITYQPFIFADNFETGVGYEFSVNEWAGLIYYPEIDQAMVDQSPELARLILEPSLKEPFRSANDDLRNVYDNVVDQVAAAVGDVSNTSFLDVGCNCGYFPIAFARRGSRQAFGCDRQDFNPTFDLLNDIVGVQAQFLPGYYHPQERIIEGVQPVDAVMSSMMLCHVSSPLSCLAALGSLARKALLVLTLVNTDNGYSIRYGEPRGDYPGDKFPANFDNKVCPSRSLIVKSMESMGFGTVRELDLTASGAPPMSWHGYPFACFLGLR